MDVDVDDVEPDIAGAGLAENGVKVSAVIIHQLSGLVGQVAYLFDSRMEQAERIRDGQHDRRHLARVARSTQKNSRLFDLDFFKPEGSDAVGMFRTYEVDHHPLGSGSLQGQLGLRVGLVTERTGG